MKKITLTLLSMLLAVITAASFAGFRRVTKVQTAKIIVFSRPTVGEVAGVHRSWNDVDSFTC